MTSALPLSCLCYRSTSVHQQKEGIFPLSQRNSSLAPLEVYTKYTTLFLTGASPNNNCRICSSLHTCPATARSAEMSLWRFLGYRQIGFGMYRYSADSGRRIWAAIVRCFTFQLIMTDHQIMFNKLIACNTPTTGRIL